MNKKLTKTQQTMIEGLDPKIKAMIEEIAMLRTKLTISERERLVIKKERDEMNAMLLVILMTFPDRMIRIPEETMLSVISEEDYRIWRHKEGDGTDLVVKAMHITEQWEEGE